MQNPSTQSLALVHSLPQIEPSLRAFMLGVYSTMALGLAVTTLAALAVSMVAINGDSSAAALGPDGAARAIGGGRYLTSTGVLLFFSPLRWLAILAPLAFVIYFSVRFDRLSARSAMATFLAVAFAIGLCLSGIVLVFAKQSIVQTFLITAAAFGSLSLWGYSTKRSLSGMSSFLIMGLVGLVLALVINLFVQLSALQFAMSGIGVLIFAGLTAYDTQKLKDMYVHGGFEGEAAAKASTFGALTLYLDFVNMFQFLLVLFGQRQE
jgi:FtsH-binding integral membrane protein